MERKPDFIDRPFLIYRRTSVGMVLYDTQCTQEAAEASMRTGQTEHPGMSFEIECRAVSLTKETP